MKKYNRVWLIEYDPIVLIPFAMLPLWAVFLVGSINLVTSARTFFRERRNSPGETRLLWNIFSFSARGEENSERRKKEKIPVGVDS